MRKNVAGQLFFFQAITTADGTAFSGTVAGTVAKDEGNAGAMTGSVALVTGGSGLYRAAPSQADTNGDALGFNFTGTGMVPVTANFDTRDPTAIANNLDAAISSRLASTAAPTNWSAMNISAGGIVESNAKQIADQTISVPYMMRINLLPAVAIPAAGTVVNFAQILLEDFAGNPVDIDGFATNLNNLTVTARNPISAADRSVNVINKARVDVGHYTVQYSVGTAHAEEQIELRAEAVTSTITYGTLSQFQVGLDGYKGAGGSQTPVADTSDGQVQTAGTWTGTHTNTHTEDQVYYTGTVVAGPSLDAEIYFDIGPNRAPTSVVFVGRVSAGTGAGNLQDFVSIQAYNYTLSAWQTITNIVNSQADDIRRATQLTRDMIAPSGDPNEGRVRIRFFVTTGNPIDVGDQLLIDLLQVYSVSQDAVSVGDITNGIRVNIPETVYPDASVWVDTARGSPGRTIGFNGTAFGQGGAGPSNNAADALAIAAQLNTRRLRLAPDATFTLTDSIDGATVFGEGLASVDLNGRSIDDAVFSDVFIKGTGVISSAPATFETCTFVEGATLPGGAFEECRFGGGTVLTLTGLAVLDACSNFEPGTSAWPTIDLNNTAGISLQINGWIGGLKLVNVPATANVVVDGLAGTLDISDASVSTGANFAISGVAELFGAPRGNIADSARISQLTPMTVGTNNDKTGYTASTVTDKTGYSISGTKTTLDALNDISEAQVLTQVNTSFTTQMTESYAANKTLPTRDQCMLAVHQHLMNFQINGTQYTVRNFADTANAYIGTLDSATNPTSQKRV